MKIELDSRKHAIEEVHWNKVEEGKDVPEGVIAEKESSDGGKYSWYKYTYPELRPELIAGVYDPVVFEHQGRRWKVKVDLNYDDGMPNHVQATFEETEDDLTEADGRAKNWGDYSHWFGQPKFIQNTPLPHVNGKSAFPLVTIEDGWGDSGNNNVLVAFDEDGTPVGLFHEYSCC